MITTGEFIRVTKADGVRIDGTLAGVVWSDGDQLIVIDADGSQARVSVRKICYISQPGALLLVNAGGGLADLKVVGQPELDTIYERYYDCGPIVPSNIAVFQAFQAVAPEVARVVLRDSATDESADDPSDHAPVPHVETDSSPGDEIGGDDGDGDDGNDEYGALLAQGYTEAEALAATSEDLDEDEDLVSAEPEEN